MLPYKINTKSSGLIDNIGVIVAFPMLIILHTFKNTMFFKYKKQLKHCDDWYEWHSKGVLRMRMVERGLCPTVGHKWLAKERTISKQLFIHYKSL